MGCGGWSGVWAGGPRITFHCTFARTDCYAIGSFTSALQEAVAKWSSSSPSQQVVATLREISPQLYMNLLLRKVKFILCLHELMGGR